MGKARNFCIALALAGALFFTGCDDSTDAVIIGNSQNGVIEHIFVPNAGNSNVAVKNLNTANGATADIVQANAGTTPVMVRTHPNQNLIYVANQGSDNISVFSVGANGLLTAVAGSPFAGPLGVTSIAVDPTGRFLYAAGNTNQIRSFTIGADGSLTNAVNLPLVSVPTQVAPVFTRTANGLFLNVAGSNGGVASIETFTVNENTGALAANSITNVAGGISVDGLSRHPSGTVLVASVEDAGANSSSLLPLTVNANGSLTQVNGSAVALAFDCGGNALSGQGVVYVGSDSSNNVAAFTVNGTNGALAALAGSPFAAGQFS
ncbi:MAG: beta-propeller fold lactonase family protein, partial [Candidatus Eremiobacteraeota bacterium]|nr:beta-propeller fold lactonase family protein [Candidatus Eremiobacteraeota bacterium]